MNAVISKCAGGSFNQGGNIKLYASNQLIATKSYGAGASNIWLYDIDPYAQLGLESAVLKAEVYSADQPTIPKDTGSSNVWTEFFGDPDVLIERFQVTRTDTGATLSQNATVPDGTPIRIQEYTLNCGQGVADDFDVDFFDNNIFVGRQPESTAIDS